MTKRRMLKLAPVMIATLLLAMAVVMILLPHTGDSEYVSRGVTAAAHQLLA